MHFCVETVKDDYDHLYKVVLVGDATVGKTHLLSRYMKGVLPRMPAATIGVEFGTKVVRLPKGGGVAKVQIWDTAGQERYRATTTAYYRNAVGALLIYDVTRRASFESCPRWLEDLRTGAREDIVVMLVGSKADLPETDPAFRQVDYETAGEFARRHGLLFVETSAVTAQNISACFDKLLQAIYDRSAASTLLEAEGKPVHLAAHSDSPQGARELSANCAGGGFGGASGGC